MKRVLEPELMDDAAQARAYAKADFSEENQGFVDRFREYFPDWAGGHVVEQLEQVGAPLGHLGRSQPAGHPLRHAVGGLQVGARRVPVAARHVELERHVAHGATSGTREARSAAQGRARRSASRQARGRDCPAGASRSGW